jgi:hypothetical protein
VKERFYISGVRFKKTKNLLLEREVIRGENLLKRENA